MERKYWKNDDEDMRFLIADSDGVYYIKDKDKKLSEASILDNLDNFRSDFLAWDKILEIETNRDSSMVSTSYKDEDDFDSWKRFNFDSKEDMEAFRTAFEKYHESRFSKNISYRSVKSMVISLVIKLLITSAIFRGIFVFAVELQSGAEVVVKGRHSGMKRLFTAVVDLLGPTGVTVVGILLVIYLFISFARKKNNPNEFVHYTFVK